jgi:hypothetical protein
MVSSETHTNKTSAETTSIGFDYQFYFFLWKILSLNPNESVGLEVKDDIHTELNNNEQILYQIKHTIQTKADGTPSNMTQSDIDLWKTLSNWAKVISDKNDDRASVGKQLKFLSITSFVLASNKSESNSNSVLRKFSEYQAGSCALSDVKNVLLNISKKSSSPTISKYVADVLNLSGRVFSQFVKRMYFELGEDDIIRKCKTAIRAHMVSANKIDEVFAGIDSAVREDNFINIKNGKKIVITFEEFYAKYKKYYELSRNGSLTVTPFLGLLPEKLESQVFIQQMLEIGDVPLSDIESIAKFTRFRLKIKNNIERWLHQGELTIQEVESLERDAINQWENEFRKTYRQSVNETEFNDKGLSVLDELRGKTLRLAGQDMDAELSNGEFYELSNSPCIGWRKDWEKYKT